MKAVEFITEAFDQPYPIEWEKWADGEAVDALATLDDGTNLSIMFRKEGTAFLCSDWMVEFQRNNSQEITGEGDAQRVFATVLKAIRQFVKKYKANTITFSASKEPKPEMVRVQGARANPESRANLYDSLIRRYASAMGYSAQQREGNGKVTYVLRRLKPGVSEGLDQSLSSMAGQDQAERKAYEAWVKAQPGATMGAEMGAKYAQLKNRSKYDVFGDAVRQDQFMKMKFDFDKFTDKDWKNYWTLAQHCDKNRDFQKNALSIIKKYQGEDYEDYQYLYDRISCGTTGKQKYGTQDICGKDKQAVSEAPLADYQTLGNFDKPGPFRGADKKLIPHPVSQLKTQKFLQNTPYDFRLFFSNIPGIDDVKESGAMEPDDVREVFGKDAEAILSHSENAITIVYVGNSGDAKKLMTPWIMAHRFGHAIQAGNRGGNKIGAWPDAEQYFFHTVNQVLDRAYGKADVQGGRRQRAPNWDLTPEYNALFNAIGTQRSSRGNQIKRPYEFLYELFAQYIKDGKITLNPLPTNLGYGKQNWGTPSKYMMLKPDYRDESTRQYEAQGLADDMSDYFAEVLRSAVGNIYVM